jgi:hypothetical protein
VTFVLNLLISAAMIAFTSWLAGRSPALAGLIIAMPISSMLVLPLAELQHGDAAKTLVMARSIFAAIPVSLMFFAPFFFAERLDLGFWQAYALGCALLPLAYLVQRAIVGA